MTDKMYFILQLIFNIGSMFYLILFIISWKKNSIPYLAFLQNVIAKYKYYFNKILLYYIPIIFFVIIGDIIHQIFSESVIDDYIESMSITSLLIIIGFVYLLFLYFIIINASLSKSFYFLLKDNQQIQNCYTLFIEKPIGEAKQLLNQNQIMINYQLSTAGQFKFYWINISQTIKIILLSFLLLILIILGFPFLMLPSLLLLYMLPFLKYPIIIENKSIYESFKKIYNI